MITSRKLIRQLPPLSSTLEIARLYLGEYGMKIVNDDPIAYTTDAGADDLLRKLHIKSSERLWLDTSHYAGSNWPKTGMLQTTHIKKRIQQRNVVSTLTRYFEYRWHIKIEQISWNAF